MAGFAPVAGAARGDADLPVPQHPHQHFALVARHGQGQDVGGVPRRHRRHLGHLSGQSGEGVRLQILHAPDVLLPAGEAQTAGGGEGGDLSGGFGAAAQPVLLAAPQQQGFEFQAGTDIQGADSLGGVDLVAADADQIGPQLLWREGHFQKPLDRVAVEQCGGAGAADELGDLPDRQQGAQFIIDQHHGHQYSVRPQGPPDLLRVDGPPGVGLQPGHLPSFLFQGPDGFQHRTVFDGGGDDVFPLPAAVFHSGTDGPVVALGAAGGEEELLGGAAQGLCHVGAVGLQSTGGLCGLGIAGGGVEIALGHGLRRGLGRLGPDPGGGGVVQICGHASTSFP